MLPQQDHVACQLLADLSELVAQSPGREVLWPRGIQTAGHNCRSLGMKPDLPERGRMLPGDKMVLHFKGHLMLLVALDTNINAGQTERQQSGKQSGKPPPCSLPG